MKSGKRVKDIPSKKSALNIKSSTSRKDTKNDDIVRVKIILDDKLPPVIILNGRPKIEPEEISVQSLWPELLPKINIEFISPPPTVPVPRDSVILSWNPSALCFDLYDEPVERRLQIENRCSRLVNVQYMDLWSETGDLGATWYVHPRCRTVLAPGLSMNLYVKAVPKDKPEIDKAYIGLQLAAGLLRDTVVAYFVVPIEAKFQNYLPIPEDCNVVSDTFTFDSSNANTNISNSNTRVNK